MHPDNTTVEKSRLIDAMLARGHPSDEIVARLNEYDLGIDLEFPEVRKALAVDEWAPNRH